MKKTKSNPIHQVLGTPGKGKTEPTGVRGKLAAFYRSILDDINMNHMWWDKLMQDWLSDYRQGINTMTEDEKQRKESRRKITSMRGNIMKELGKPEMTFKVFYKGLRFLQPFKVELSATIYWRTNKVTQHTQTLDFSDRTQLAAMLEELKETEEDKDEDTDE